MNERIKELYVQAIQYADSVVPKHDRYNDIYYSIVSGKHAELIVRECLDIVANADMSELEGPDPEDVLYVACKQIKEHFGVEE